jgi:Phytanoyl-CoA dioxygenase (PhyH)
MWPFTVKKNELHLNQQMLNSYDDQGYLIVPMLYNYEEVLKMATNAENLYETAINLEKNCPNPEILATTPGVQDLKIMHQGTEFVVRKENKKFKAIARVVWAGAAANDLLDFGRAEKLTAKVGQILKSSHADHLINQIHYKLPNDGVDFGVHQDVQNRKLFNDQTWADVNNRGSYVVAITAIDEVTADNGPLKVIPGSHKNKELDFQRMKTIPEFQEQYGDKFQFNIIDDARELIMKPGDTVFINPYTVHYSLPNEGSNSRKVLINGYSYPGINKKQYPGEGSAQLIRLDHNWQFADILLGANIAIKSSSMILSLIKAYQDPSVEYNIKFLNNAVSLFSVCSGFNPITLGVNIGLNVGMFGYNYFASFNDQSNYWKISSDILNNFASGLLAPALKDVLTGYAASYLPQADALLFAGQAYGIAFTAYNAYSLTQQLNDDFNMFALIGLSFNEDIHEL